MKSDFYENKLENGKWYWVCSDLCEWFPAKRSKDAAGGWTNEDTWEDWGDDIVIAIPITHPDDILAE